MQFELTEPVYRCPKCNGLLDVVHDVNALRNRSAEDWKQLFASRYAVGPWPHGSGVWGKREWVAPQLPDDAIVSMDEGHSTLLRAEAERDMAAAELDDMVLRAPFDGVVGFTDLAEGQLVDSADPVTSLDDLALVVSDVEMPRLDGYALTSEIRHDPALRDLYVLLHTSLSGVSNRAMVERVGADCFITKFSRDELSRALRARLDALAGRRAA